MTEPEVRRLVRREIESIRKAESGELPPTPYVVVEIIRRLKTMKPWEGMAASEPMGGALRTMIEEILGKRSPRPGALPAKESEEPEDLRTVPPLEAARRLGTKRHRHLKQAV